MTMSAEAKSKSSPTLFFQRRGQKLHRSRIARYRFSPLCKRGAGGICFSPDAGSKKQILPNPPFSKEGEQR